MAMADYIKRDIIRQYRRFRQEGQRAIDAAQWSRALVWAAYSDIDFGIEPEQERYRDVYGDDPSDPDATFVIAVAYRREDDGTETYLDSLRMVEDNATYLRTIYGDMALELYRRHMDDLREEYASY